MYRNFCQRVGNKHKHPFDVFRRLQHSLKDIHFETNLCFQQS